MKTYATALLISAALSFVSQAGESWRSLHPKALRAWLGSGKLIDAGGARDVLGEPDTTIRPQIVDALQYKDRADLVWIYRMDDGSQLHVQFAQEPVGPTETFEVREYRLWKRLPDGTRSNVWSQSAPMIKVRVNPRALLHPPTKNRLPPGDYQYDTPKTVG